MTMKNIFSFIFLLFAGISLVSAQLSDKLVHSFGYFAEQFFPIDVNTPLASTRFTTALNYSTYYAALQKNDLISVGVMGGATVGARIYQSPVKAAMTSDIMLQIPVFVMARIGANATPYSESRFGIAAGAGVSFTSASYFQYYNGGDLARYLFNRVDPQVVGEVTIPLGGNGISFRAHISPIAWTANTRVSVYHSLSNIEEVNVPARISNFGLGIVYGF